MNNDIFWNQYLKNEAVRISKKNDENFDKRDAETRSREIELMIEDLKDKYRE